MAPHRWSRDVAPAHREKIRRVLQTPMLGTSNRPLKDTQSEL